MASSDSSKSGIQKHRPLHSSRSFSRIESTSTETYPPRIQRANTLGNEATVVASEIIAEINSDDAELVSNNEQVVEDAGKIDKLLETYDELPVDLKNLSDRFIDSVSVKVHQVSPVDKLSILFQDFYPVALDHINAHLTSLSSPPKLQLSSSSSLSSISSKAKRLRAKATSNSSSDRSRNSPEPENSDQQLLTPEEIADKKEARKTLERRRLALEEGVERRVCESTYDQIWRHQSTHDEAKDEKLRSRTAALSLVGIGLKDLGVNVGGKENNDEDAIKQKEAEIKEQLKKTRNELFAMNDIKYPLGKLQCLKVAHKSIVNTLSQFHPSSSADEIMPMLIYTLITSRPEGINIISNLHFIQRFRNETKIDGEAAYCLTNLEAAISFLQTVDLASLRADEMLSGPPKSAVGPHTPSIEIFDPLLNPPTPKISVLSSEMNHTISKPKQIKSGPLSVRLQSAPRTRNRGLSDLFQSSPTTLGAAGDAVLNSADQGLETIGNSLGDSYKFLMGKLKGRHYDGDDNKTEVIGSRNLEDAQELVGTTQNNEESRISSAPLPSSEMSSRPFPESSAKIEDKLPIPNGFKLPHNKNQDSNKRYILMDDGAEKSPLPSPSLASPNPALIESMRNLGNTLNPMNRISGIGVMRVFGRGNSPSPDNMTNAAVTSVSKINSSSDNTETEFSNVNGPNLFAKELTDVQVTPNMAPVRKEIKIAPPIAKFMDLQSPGDIKLNEVMELLRDYRRLAAALKDLGAV